MRKTQNTAAKTNTLLAVLLCCFHSLFQYMKSASPRPNHAAIFTVFEMSILAKRLDNAVPSLKHHLSCRSMVLCSVFA